MFLHVRQVRSDSINKDRRSTGKTFRPRVDIVILVVARARRMYIMLRCILRMVSRTAQLVGPTLQGSLTSPPLVRLIPIRSDVATLRNTSLNGPTRKLLAFGIPVETRAKTRLL